MPLNPDLTPCPICGQLRDVETSFYKYAAPEYDHPLPAASQQLIKVPDGRGDDEHHTRICPRCQALYAYDVSYEYHVNGSEDEETLARLDADQLAAFYLAQAQQLEALRQEIDRLESSAGQLGDQIDRAHLSPAQARSAYEDMQAQRQNAAQLRQELQTRVEGLRQVCPQILHIWSEAHQRVCRHYLAHLPPVGEDAQTARFAAQSALAAWQQLPQNGPTFIPVDSVWLEGYLQRLTIR